MAITSDQQPKPQAKQQGRHSHCCHICKQVSNCERELGGHKRAGGIRDEDIAGSKEEPTITAGGLTYAFRNHPTRHRTTHIHKNCDEAFPSRKPSPAHSHGSPATSAGDEEDETADHCPLPCKVVLTSHEAPGGHRASHKRVKRCFTIHFEVESPVGSENAPMRDGNNQIGSSLENMALSIVQLAEKSKKLVCSVCRGSSCQARHLAFYPNKRHDI